MKRNISSKDQTGLFKRQKSQFRGKEGFWIYCDGAGRPMTESDSCRGESDRSSRQIEIFKGASNSFSLTRGNFGYSYLKCRGLIFRGIVSRDRKPYGENR